MIYRLIQCICLIAASWTFPADASAKSGPDPRAAKPNILFIYADDWGWKDLGIAGSAYYETPAIDRLAREGAYFPVAYSAGPNCAPSRASLMTGLYTPRHGIFTVGTAERGDSTKRKLIPVKNITVLGPHFTTIAEEFRHAGYATGLIGKWQLGDSTRNADALSQGFGHVISSAPGTSSYFSPYYNDRNVPRSPHLNLPPGPDQEYLTDRMTGEAIKFIRANAANPFFLYLSYFAVHTPIQAKDSLIAKYKRKKGDEHHHNPVYAAMIESVDHGVDRLLSTLEALNLSENTIVVFYSDNGGMGAVTSQHPLRGSKGMLYEGGIRVPLIIRWKGSLQPSLPSTPVSGIDFYPTLLELAGIREPLNKQTDGRSFAPLLFGKNLPERDLFWHFPAYLEAYKGDFRNTEPFRTTPVSVIRSGNYKLLEFYEDGRKELFDLSRDTGESLNLAGKAPEIVRELQQKLAAWKKELHAPEPAVRNPHYKTPGSSR